MSEARMPAQPGPAIFTVISRKALVRSIVVAVVIAAGIVSLDLMQRTMHLTFTKDPKRLDHPLPMISKQFGQRYLAEGYDENMEEAILEVLGTRDYLLRTYRDLQKPGDKAEFLKINLNYYETGSATPHVPEICWAGSGMNEALNSRQVFEVPNVTRRDGRVVTLRVRLISFLPAGESESPDRLKNVAYLFNVNGEYVATPQEVISRFWKASNKYAYDTKIEITVGKDGEYTSQDQAKAAVSDFLRASLAYIEESLPSADGPLDSGSVPGPAAPGTIPSK